MYRDNKSGKIGIIITIVILIFLVIFSNLNNNIWTHITNPLTKITMTVQSGVIYLKNKISKNDAYFIQINDVQKENNNLKNENNELKQQLQELEIVKAENKTFKSYLELSDKYKEYKTIPGYIIQTDISNYSKNITINLGKNDGIENGMTVIADGGLVGYIISVQDNTSKVETIIDTANAVSAVISGTEKSLVTRGILDSNDKLKGTYIDNDMAVNVGDIIQTSGIGGIYPKGINIGRIKEICNNQNKTNRYVYVEPSVDFNKLSNILVIESK